MMLLQASHCQLPIIVKPWISCRWQQTDDNCKARGDTLKCGDGSFRSQLKRLVTLIYNLTESHIQSKKSLGVEATSYEAMLSSVFLAKLPWICVSL